MSWSTSGIFRLALKALASTFLLYLLWGVVMGVGAALILFAGGLLGLVAGAPILIFGLAMALLSSSAVMIKVSVGEATSRAERRMDSETRNIERRTANRNRRSGRGDPPISERPSAFEEAARRRADEEAKRRQAADQEKSRQAAEEARRRQAADREARRQAAEEARRRQAADREARRQATEEAARRRAADQSARDRS